MLECFVHIRMAKSVTYQINVFFNIRLAMVIKKHSELVKKQARDRYGRFASPSSMQEVESSSRCRTAPPSHQEA
jgi:hypothetical protein